MVEVRWSVFTLELALGVCGFLLLALTSWNSPSARRRGSRTHWARGWLLNGVGMSLIGLSWVSLGLSEPRLDSPLLAWLGVPVGLLGGGLFLGSARRVGRLKAPSRYSLELDTSGPYSLVRHPQALALILVAVSIGLVTRSVPFLLSVPVWILCWLGYTFLEEELELVPAFGRHYIAYRRQTPRLWPRFETVREGMRRVFASVRPNPRARGHKSSVGYEDVPAP